MDAIVTPARAAIVAALVELLLAGVDDNECSMTADRTSDGLRCGKPTMLAERDAIS